MNNSIELQGLTALQCELADMIWGCDSSESVDLLIRGLPSRLRTQAETVHELMIAAVWDQVQTVDPWVAELIQRCRG